MDLKSKKDRYTLLTTIAFILLIIGLIKRYTEPKKVLKWNFKGVVEKVRYDNQKHPLVTVNGKEYFLFYTIWDSNVKIFKGDTIIKEKGDLRIKLIRPNSKDTLYDRNYPISKQ